jgi:hypothetical protein
VDQREVVGDLLLPSNEEPTESVHPRVGSLDDPPTSASSEELAPTFGRLSSPAYVALEPVSLYDFLPLREVVPLVQTDSLASPAWRSHGSRLQGPFDQLAVVPIGGSHPHPEWNTPTIGEETPLHARLPSVGGVGASSFATEGSLRHRSFHRLPRPIHTGLVNVGKECLLPQPLEDPHRAPLLEAVMDSALGTEASRESTPLNARPENVHDARKAAMVVGPWSSSPRRGRVARQQWRDSFPERSREIVSRWEGPFDEHSESLIRQRVKAGLDPKRGFRIGSKVNWFDIGPPGLAPSYFAGVQRPRKPACCGTRSRVTRF